MTISRRNFLKYGTITIAGMSVPGLVRAGLPGSGALQIPLEGEESWAQTICRLCPGGCGIKVRRIGRYPVNVRGNQSDPISKGTICPRGAATIQELYHPDRLKQPLARTGDRGAGRWRPIGWDEAMRMVADKLIEIKDRPASLAVISGSSATTSDLLLRRFTHAFGSPNYLEFGMNLNQLPVDAFSAMQGESLGVRYDLTHSGYVVSFGMDWLQAFPSPVEASRAYGELRRSRPDVRVRVVQIEPRMSISAAKADEWVPIRPSTEGALALAMAYVMIDEGLVNAEFVKKHCFGFDDWAGDDGTYHRGFRSTVLSEYSPEVVAEITDVPANVIRRLGREFGKSQRPLALGMRGRLFDQMAIHSLNALAGSIGVPGGVVQAAGDPYALLSDVDVQPHDIPLDNGFNRRLGHSAAGRLHGALFGSKPYDLKALILCEANPAFLGPDTNKWMQALRQIPFIVSLTSFIDDTSEYADVILPIHSNLERKITWAGWTIEGSPLIKKAGPAIKPLYDTREPGDIVLRLAKAIGDKTLAATQLPGSKESVKTPGPGFKTSTGKFEFCSPVLGKALAGEQIDCVPHYEPVEYLGDRENYPFHLYVYSPLSLHGGDGAHLPFLPGIAGPQVHEGWGTWVELNPETAGHLGVSDGEDVVIESPLGRIRARARLYAGAMPDVVSIPVGFGHTSYGRWAKDVGSNPAAVIGSALDPHTGQPNWQSTRVRILKAV